MINFLSLFSYLFSVFFFFSINSTLITWILLELNIIFFIFYFFNYRGVNLKEFTFNQCLLYFIVQSMGSFLFLIGFIFQHDWVRYDLILILSMSIKLGIIPFHFWIFNISLYIPTFCLFFILTFQKIPLIIVISSLYNELLIFILLINLIWGSWLIFRSKNIEWILVRSSIYSLIWIFIFYFARIILFFSFCFFYFFSNLGVILIKNNITCNKWSRTFFLFFIIFLISYPPFPLFFIKIISLNFILINSIIFFITIWRFTLFASISYINFSLFYFFNIEGVYHFKILSKKLIIFLIGSMAAFNLLFF